MSRKLYVGGLAWATTDEGLTAAFAPFGNLVSAKVVKDRETGRSRGFGFVEMSTDVAAKAAISGLDGTMVEGRNLTVNLAKPREGGSRGGRGGGGGGGGGRW